MHSRQILSALSIALCAFATQALAVPILVDEWDSQNSGNAVPADVKAAIDGYNSNNDPDLPGLFDSQGSLLDGWELCGGEDDIKDGPKTFEWTAPGDSSHEYYLLSKYGGGGAAFDTALHHLWGGDELTYNPGGDAKPNGLSHYIIWCRETETNVPDGGATVLLLGLALTGIAIFRRRSA